MKKVKNSKHRICKSGLHDYSRYINIIEKTAIIPEGMTEIGYGAFANCKYLTKIEIPISVKRIGARAFAGCVNLTDIEVPNEVTVIEDSAFSGCSSLQFIEIPNSVTKIEDHAFEDCKALTSIRLPNSISWLGDGVFANCISLTSVRLPERLDWISNRLFQGCESLEKVVLPEVVESIGTCAFENCYHLAEITIPDSVTTIGERTFAGCIGLKSIEIPSGVISIDGSFVNYTNLDRLVVSPLNSHFSSSGNCLLSKGGTELYAGCKASIIPDTVTRICPWSFRGSIGLRSIKISEQIEWIGEESFEECDDLEEIDIPDNNMALSYDIFALCTSLKSVKLHFVDPLRATRVLKRLSLCNLSEISLYTPIGTGYAYRHNSYYSEFKEIIPIL